ncbi:MAG: hypothetical protein VYA18_16545, partial [Pseudomonadota bacterium]|nr:hypothetical protein [Pseudomonadota bacterium]
RWKMRNGKILIESKEEIKERLGSSPDEADAIVEALGWKQKAELKKVLRTGAESRMAPLGDPLDGF